MTDREIMQMVLDALEHGLPIIEDFGGKEQLQIQHKAISALYEALRAALAQPEQEPVALPDWFNHAFPGGKLEAFGFHMPTPRAYAEEMYKRWQRRFDELSTPPQREWQGLTDEERKRLYKESRQPKGAVVRTAEQLFETTCRAIEAKLKEKNS